jgi:hypothetical protein
MRWWFVAFLAGWVCFGAWCVARALALISHALTRRRIPLNVGFALSVPLITAFAVYAAKSDIYHGPPPSGFEGYLWVACAVSIILAVCVPFFTRRGL